MCARVYECNIYAYIYAYVTLHVIFYFKALPLSLLPHSLLLCQSCNWQSAHSQVPLLNFLHGQPSPLNALHHRGYTLILLSWSLFGLQLVILVGSIQQPISFLSLVELLQISVTAHGYSDCYYIHTVVLAFSFFFE